MSFKEVFIEPRERWHRAIVPRTNQKTRDNSHKTEKYHTAFLWNNSIQRGRKSQDGFWAALLIPLCLFPPKLKWPAVARLTSILKKPHVMLALLQGRIHSLDNEVKLSGMEHFSSPTFSSLYSCSLTRPTEILFCLCALRTYWSQHAMNCIPRAFFGFVRKN